MLIIERARNNVYFPSCSHSVAIEILKGVAPVIKMQVAVQEGYANATPLISRNASHIKFSDVFPTNMTGLN
jgi:hypothetical protein